MNLYRKHRPKTLQDLYGQPEVVNLLTKMHQKGNIPQAMLFLGGSGTGKTTTARIVARMLGCDVDAHHPMDFQEVNCAEVRGIDDVRGIQSRIRLSPMNSPCRIWLIDEAHGLTPDAQDAFLKTLEDTPPNVYFMLATTNPSRLKATIKNRCTPITLKPLNQKVMKGLLLEVLSSEGGKLTEEVIDKVVELAEGSARKALVLLEKVLGIVGEDDQLSALGKLDEDTASFKLCQIMIKPGCQFSDLTKILRQLDDDAEGIRKMVLSYFASVMLNPSNKANPATLSLASKVIRLFESDFYSSGTAGLVQACFLVCQK